MDSNFALAGIIFVCGIVLNGVECSECKAYKHGDILTIPVTSEVQNISSPNYPQVYASFDVKCTKDFLVINKGPITGSIYEGCWRNSSSTVINTTVSTGVRFQSNGYDNGKGFFLLFSDNLQALQTSISNLENGNNGGNGNTNNTGNTNGTLGETNSSTRLVYSCIYVQTIGRVVASLLIVALASLLIVAFFHLY